MDTKPKKLLAYFGYSFVGWMICAFVMGMGMGLTTELNAMILHATIPPVIIGLMAWGLHSRFAFMVPLETATSIVLTIVLMDLFVVSLLILGNFDMFLTAGSVLGTYIPITTIFFTTYIVGTRAQRDAGRTGARQSAVGAIRD